MIISSRETAYKVNNLRRDPRAALCAFTTSFHGEGSSQWQRGNHFSSDAMNSLVYLQQQVYGEHKSWPEFHARMVRERRVIIRFAIESVRRCDEDKRGSKRSCSRSYLAEVSAIYESAKLVAKHFFAFRLEHSVNCNPCCRAKR